LKWYVTINRFHYAEVDEITTNCPALTSNTARKPMSVYELLGLLRQFEVNGQSLCFWCCTEDSKNKPQPGWGMNPLGSVLLMKASAVETLFMDYYNKTRCC
jgi:hypothetical protein